MGGEGKAKAKRHEHDVEGGCGNHGNERKAKRRNAYESQPKAKGGGSEVTKS